MLLGPLDRDLDDQCRQRQAASGSQQARCPHCPVLSCPVPWQDTGRMRSRLTAILSARHGPMWWERAAHTNEHVGRLVEPGPPVGRPVAEEHARERTHSVRWEWRGPWLHDVRRGVQPPRERALPGPSAWSVPQHARAPPDGVRARRVDGQAHDRRRLRGSR